MPGFVLLDPSAPGGIPFGRLPRLASQGAPGRGAEVPHKLGQVHTKVPFSSRQATSYIHPPYRDSSSSRPSSSSQSINQPTNPSFPATPIFFPSRKEASVPSITNRGQDRTGSNQTGRHGTNASTRPSNSPQSPKLLSHLATPGEEGQDKDKTRRILQAAADQEKKRSKLRDLTKVLTSPEQVPTDTLPHLTLPRTDYPHPRQVPLLYDALRSQAIT